MPRFGRGAAAAAALRLEQGGTPSTGNNTKDATACAPNSPPASLGCWTSKRTLPHLTY